MGRLAAIAFVLAASFAAVPGAHAAALVPLAPAASWGSPPIFATSPPGDPRLFVVERGTPGMPSTSAAIRLVKDGVLQPTPFLVVPNVDASGERGLLSLAFTPDYATSGLFYVFKVASDVSPRQIQVVRYKVSTNPDLADPAPQATFVNQPLSGATNHNGGQLAFGPDGKLYVTIGENANTANSQTLTNILGKVLRLNADGSIPADNPFVSTPGARGEIWTLGLRNPFRAGFTPDGRLVIADVQGGGPEEVNLATAGANFGWPTCEGPCSPANPSFVDPVFSYPHPPDGNCAVIGGYVVRDRRLTDLFGRYLYGDLCKADLRTLDLGVAGADPKPAGLTYAGGGDLQSFGEDSRGCSYVLADSTVYRVAPAADSGAACPEPLPEPPAPPPPGPPPPPTVFGDPPGLPPPLPPAPAPRAIALLVKERLTMDRKGRVRVRIACSGGLPCSGALSLRTAKATRAGGAKSKRVVKLGMLRFRSLVSGRQTFATFALDAKARKIAAELRSFKVKLTLGGVERTTTLTAAR